MCFMARFVGLVEIQSVFSCVQMDDLETMPQSITKDGFDVITCLNVLDRCDKPLTLLQVSLFIWMLYL